jgi:hypothetical protein
MSVFAELLDIARRQLALAQEGDIDSAISLIEAREKLMLDAPASVNDAADEASIRAVLTLDRDLATAIRQRMIAVRHEAAEISHGRTALIGYRPPLGQRPSRRLNAVG